MKLSDLCFTYEQGISWLYSQLKAKPPMDGANDERIMLGLMMILLEKDKGQLPEQRDPDIKKAR